MVGIEKYPIGEVANVAAEESFPCVRREDIVAKGTIEKVYYLQVL